MMTGTCWPGPFFFYSNAINHQFIRAIKTDTLGEVIWDKFLNMDDDNFTLWQQAKSIAATSDGHFLICGVDHKLYAEEKAYFVKIDTEGDTIWTKKFPFENTAKSLKMIPLENDEFVSVSDFPTGLYFFTIRCNQKITQTGKILIKH